MKGESQQHNGTARQRPRSIRMDDELWDQVRWAVRVNNAESVTAVIRQCLREYVRKTQAQQRRQQGGAGTP